MDTLKNNKIFFSFSQPKSFMLFFRYIDNVFYFMSIIATLLSYYNLKGQQFKDVLIIMCTLVLIVVLFGKFLSKVIWRVDIDFRKEEIKFYLCRKDNPICVHFSKIERIVVSGPIFFYFEKKRYLYSTNKYYEILPILKTVKSINWGKMCDSLGPNKLIRDKIDGK